MLNQFFMFRRQRTRQENWFEISSWCNVHATLVKRLCSVVVLWSMCCWEFGAIFCEVMTWLSSINVASLECCCAYKKLSICMSS